MNQLISNRNSNSKDSFGMKGIFIVLSVVLAGSLIYLVWNRNSHPAKNNNVFSKLTQSAVTGCVDLTESEITVIRNSVNTYLNDPAHSSIGHSFTLVNGKRSGLMARAIITVDDSSQNDKTTTTAWAKLINNEWKVYNIGSPYPETSIPSCLLSSGN